MFSDDDPAFLTSTVLDCLSIQAHELSNTPNPDRVVVIDLGPNGKTVTAAQSLSPDWQVSSTTITPAPSWNETETEKRQGNLMLTISGTEGHGRPVYPQRRSSINGTFGRMDAVMTGYHERLNALDKLVKKDVVGDIDAEVAEQGDDDNDRAEDADHTY